MVAMTCRVGEVVRWLEDTFPPAWAETWDAVGLQVGDLEAPLERVLVALDPTFGAVRAAVEGRAALLVTHHPIWFQALEAIRLQDPVGKVLWEAIRGGVSVFCAHTNLDRAPDGPNDLLAQRLELVRVEELEDGMGRVGVLPKPLSWDAFCQGVQNRFPGATLRMAGRFLEPIRKVAVCCGSGASLLESAHQKGTQVLVTGDGKYHDARKAEALGMALLDIGHFASERILVPWLVKVLSQKSERSGWGLTVKAYGGEQDPFRVLAIPDQDVDPSVEV